MGKFFLSFLLFLAAPAVAQSSSLLAELRAGGYVLYLRHASTVSLEDGISQTLGWMKKVYERQ